MLAFLCLAIALLLLAEASLSPGRRPKERGVLVTASVAVTGVFLVVLWQDGQLAKTLGTLVMPAGLLWLAGLAVVFAQLARRDVSGAAVTGTLWLIYTAVGSPLVGAALVAPLERSVQGIDPFASTYDAVVVLGGGTATRDQYNFLGHSGDRVMLGARLWHMQRTKTLVTTGATAANVRNAHNSAAVTTAIWTSLGIPQESIIQLAWPTDTKQEIAAIAALKRQHGWHRVGLVSSARHLPRAMANARELGVELTPLPADFASAGHADGLMAFIPNGRGFYLVHTAAWEHIGRLAGK